MTVKIAIVHALTAVTGWPRMSLPAAAAVHEPFAVPELMVYVTSTEPPAPTPLFPYTTLFRSHAPPPATLTLVIVLSPVFFSVTTTVIVVFGATVVPGETLLVVSVVAG